MRSASSWTIKRWLHKREEKKSAGDKRGVPVKKKKCKPRNLLCWDQRKRSKKTVPLFSIRRLIAKSLTLKHVRQRHLRWKASNRSENSESIRWLASYEHQDLGVAGLAPLVLATTSRNSHFSHSPRTWHLKRAARHWEKRATNERTIPFCYKDQRTSQRSSFSLEIPGKPALFLLHLLPDSFSSLLLLLSSYSTHLQVLN